jgi:hypothetical protein
MKKVEVKVIAKSKERMEKTVSRINDAENNMSQGFGLIKYLR